MKRQFTILKGFNLTTTKALVVMVFMLVFIGCFSQTDSTKLRFFQPSPTPNKGRIIGLSTGFPVAYAGTMYALSQAWYADTETSKFHFFNDGKEWMQIDKMGHLHTSYFESYWSIRMLKWAGVPKKRAVWIGGAMGFAFQTSIEIFDGFSEKWGASGWDVLFNGMGSALAISQELAWGEQRFKTKYSFHEVSHEDAMLQQRAEDLYGASTLERTLKDYNGIVMWLTVNPSAFKPNAKRLRWFNLAFGYGASGMYGGFLNEWENQNNQLVTRYDVTRYRRFFVSVDLDWERLPAKKPGWKTLMSVLSVVKLPAPALEFNTKGEIVFHPMFFLNWNYPLYLKR